MEVYIWIGIAVVSLIVEVATSGLTTIWFIPPALISMVLALLHVPVAIQIAAFVILSALMILLFYKKLKENIEKKSEKTNIDALIGKEAIAEQDITYRSMGRVKVGGMSWSAYIEKDAQTISKGDFVKILSIDGVKLKVEKAEIQEKV
ncbi:MAG: NfeD family protein [Ruminococcaceae bacterium]|nr:NfeD family protein [Oscillospiraceae bacterium]